MSWLLSAVNDSAWLAGAGAFVAALGAVLWFVPGRCKAWAVAAVCLAAGAGFGLVERGNYLSEKEGRVADQLAAEQAIAAKIQEAKRASDDAIAANARADQARAETQTVYLDRIIHDPPSACPPSAAARDASEFVRNTVAARPAGGPTAK